MDNQGVQVPTAVAMTCLPLSLVGFGMHRADAGLCGCNALIFFRSLVLVAVSSFLIQPLDGAGLFAFSPEKLTEQLPRALTLISINSNPYHRRSAKAPCLPCCQQEPHCSDDELAFTMASCSSACVHPAPF